MRNFVADSGSRRGGTVMAKDEAEAKERAIDRFKLSDQQVKRLVVNPRR